MMKLQKPLLLLAALMLCCCIDTLHAIRWRGCHCMRTSPNHIPDKFIKKIDVIPRSGQCRRDEIIVTMKNGYKVCLAPAEKWVKDLVKRLYSGNETTEKTDISANTSL